MGSRGFGSHCSLTKWGPSNHWPCRYRIAQQLFICPKVHSAVLLFSLLRSGCFSLPIHSFATNRSNRARQLLYLSKDSTVSCEICKNRTYFRWESPPVHDDSGRGFGHLKDETKQPAAKPGQSWACMSRDKIEAS